MRNHTPEMIDLLSRKSSEAFLLAKIGPPNKSGVDGDTFRYAAAPFDIMHEELNYPTNSGLIGLDNPRVSDSVDKASYNIVISDPSGDMRDYFGEIIENGTLVGAPATVFGGFINITGASEYGVDAGQPYNQRMIVYRGKISSVRYVLSNDGAGQVTLTCGSPMAALDLHRSLLTTPSYAHDKYGESDTTYDQNLVGSSTLILRWGKST
jgi:hypothetical protein